MQITFKFKKSDAIEYFAGSIIEQEINAANDPNFELRFNHEEQEIKIFASWCGKSGKTDLTSALDFIHEKLDYELLQIRLKIDTLISKEHTEIELTTLLLIRDEYYSKSRMIPRNKLTEDEISDNYQKWQMRDEKIVIDLR